MVALDRDYRLGLARAPDVAQACRQVWGEPELATTVVPLKQLLGMLGAAEWRRKGLAVPGLEGLIHPHYGVYLPTRTDFCEAAPRVKHLRWFVLVVLRQHVALSSADAAALGAAPAAEQRGAGV